ncbi:MAG: hypothetical protein DRH51_04925 [Candidatus Coatesbacteria bacterium]|nr:MAG: hypothetical protein DRH51_04925 [Candidatus Coatesbacteria bacterium]
MRRLTLAVSIIALIVLVLSCGEDDGNGGTENYIPHKDGSTWTYQVTSNLGPPYQQTQTINGTRNIQGINCQVIETIITLDPNHITRSFFVDNDTDKQTFYGFEEEEGGEITYYSEFPEGIVFLRYPFTVGDEWEIYSAEGIKPTECPFISDYFDDDDFDDDGQDDTMDISIKAKVEAQEDVKVTAGDFSNCYRILYSYDITLHCTDMGEIDIDYTDTVWVKPYTGTVKWQFSMELPDPMPDNELVAELIDYSLP